MIANAITSTYDDQPLTYASRGEGPEPTLALHAAACAVGGDGVPPRRPIPRRETNSRDWGAPTQPSLHQLLHTKQRPTIPERAHGALDAVQDHSTKSYNDDDTAPRWSRDALSNAVGWRILDAMSELGSDEALILLRRVAGQQRVGDSTLLADVATGLDIRADNDRLREMACVAHVIAFADVQGSGWLTFARNTLWRRAVELDPELAGGLLTEQISQAFGVKAYTTNGATQALIEAFAVKSPTTTDSSGMVAFACWDAAYDVIEQRLPGITRYDISPPYRPDAPSPQLDLEDAMARLTLAALALPARSDRRRALVAAGILLKARPATAQRALARVLLADLGAGPTTWMLHLLNAAPHGDTMEEELTSALRHLCLSDYLSVRVLAAELIEKLGHPAPAPPATPAHPKLVRSVADVVMEPSE
jgi:hypothetical protein